MGCSRRRDELELDVAATESACACACLEEFEWKSGGSRDAKGSIALCCTLVREFGREVEREDGGCASVVR